MSEPTVQPQDIGCLACAGCVGCLICGGGTVVLGTAGLAAVNFSS